MLAQEAPPSPLVDVRGYVDAYYALNFPASGLIVKLEGRYDRSTAPSFSGANDEFLAVLGAAAAF
jgi:hypothetical protein